MSLGSFMPMFNTGGGFERDPFERFVTVDLRMDEVVGAGPTQVVGPKDSGIFDVPFIGGSRMNLVKSPAKFGKSAGSFSGNGDQAQSQHVIHRWWPNDLSWEFWIYLPARKGSDACVLDMRTVTDNYEPYLVLTNSGALNLSVQNGGRITTPVLSLGSWHHVSIGRLGGVWSLYLNGVRVNNNYTNTTEFGEGRLTLGTYMDQWGAFSAHHFLGGIDNLRMWKGVSIRNGAASFPVPKRPYKPVPTKNLANGTQTYTTATSSSNIFGYYSSFFNPPRGEFSGSQFIGIPLDYVQGQNGFIAWNIKVGIREASMADYIQIFGRGAPNGLRLTRNGSTANVTTLNYHHVDRILEWSATVSTTVGAALFNGGGPIEVTPI